MSFFFRRKSNTDIKNKENESKAESAAAIQKDDGELVAVIMAAIMNMLSANTPGSLHIKSIRRIGRTSPVWNIAGRNEYIASKL
jgi:hypothetical protein